MPVRVKSASRMPLGWGVAAGLGLVVPAPGWAEAPPQPTHTMVWAAHETRHLAGDGGAINHHHEVQVTVALQAAQRVVVTDSGKRSEHNLYSRGGQATNSDDTTQWRNLWVGTYELSGDKLVLKLTLDSRKCTHEKKWNDEKPTPLDCPPVSQALGLACQSGPVTTDDGGKRAQVAAWTCTPTAATQLADTPTRWVLGKAGCVMVVAGHGPMGYRPCPKAAP